ncbi:PEP-CTERM sorting domain-containing protein [Adhaeretor mobilis]|uniref:PEP-CTERM protein-sorting domain-containing protein n=1 Tax=Adhaeretor mobilis TaxID=1930276 RepID=A0A517N1B6_9BACT|nr:PEP-CTERM sorting domain-containing protein [Adhaeretor mobilis]QDT00923.1 hypothetical protein HG15A2_42650 [Adhaeretor mobilis]
MAFRRKQASILTFLVLVGCVIGSATYAAEKSVGTLVVDTYISDDGDDPEEEPDDVQGARTNITIRGGSDGANSLNAKAFLTFDLTEAIDPTLPYFLEVTTDVDGSSGDTFGVYSITDPDLRAIIDETTLTWNVAAASAPGAVESFRDLDAVGNEVAQFLAPGTTNTPILSSFFGSDIQSFGPGLGSAVFGIVGGGNQQIDIKSKELAAGVGAARLFSFDNIDSNGSGGGPINATATWVNNAVPVAGNTYRVVSGDIVEADGAGTFQGNAMIVADGGTLDFTADGFDQDVLYVNAGANLTQNSSGDFALGDINALGTLILDGTATMNPSAGSDIFIDMVMSGTGNMVVNSNGTGSDLFLSAATAHTGTITFAGSGDEVLYTEPNSGIGGRLEMNSTGANRLVFNGDGAGGGTTAFNQAGSIDHRSTVDRLNGTSTIEANAPVAIDLTKTFVGNERRLFINDTITGSADITVNGTATDPTSGSTTLNELEVNNTDQGSDIEVGTYSGTMTTNDFVNVEIRREFPAAAFVVNSGGVLEMGSRNINTQHTLRMGEITVNAGGALIVGHEVDDQHVPLELHVASDSGQSGDLTLASTSTLTMQVSGTGANDFDKILVDGTANLDGTLQILVNPAVPSQTDTITAGPYVPTLGDTFDIIRASTGQLANFDGLNGVDGDDLAVWNTSYGVDDGADADGDGNSDGVDFLTWQTEFGAAAGGGGTLIDNSLVLSVIDAGGAFTGTGLEFQLNVSSSLIQLEVVSAGAVSAVPEPTTSLMLLCAAFGFAGTRRGRLPA